MSNPLEKLKKEQIDFLVQLGKKMNKQDNRSTAHVLFMVEEEKKICVDYSWGSHDLVERKEEYNTDDMCDSCQDKLEKDEEVPEDCSECSSECFNFYSLERQTVDTAGVFFTAEACEEHIRLNHYHYRKPKSYGVSAWRNDEMQEIQKILSILGSDEGQVEHNYI